AVAADRRLIAQESPVLPGFLLGRRPPPQQTEYWQVAVYAFIMRSFGEPGARRLLCGPTRLRRTGRHQDRAYEYRTAGCHRDGQHQRLGGDAARRRDAARAGSAL